MLHDKPVNSNFSKGSAMTDQKKQQRAAVQVAIGRFGGCPEVAEAIGCSVRTVYRWRDGETQIPSEYAIDVAEAVGLDKSDFRPDLWEYKRD